jgi:hypothetical protein
MQDANGGTTTIFLWKRAKETLLRQISWLIVALNEAVVVPIMVNELKNKRKTRAH